MIITVIKYICFRFTNATVVVAVAVVVVAVVEVADSVDRLYL